MSDKAGNALYVYEDLSRKDAVRLIQLNNINNAYTISTFMVEDTPPYHALSYCWGEADRSEMIISDKGIVRVTPHLQLALAELVSIPYLQTWFWIDQISVNQDDLEERSHQVQLMPKIYSRATRTVIWLGPRSPSHSQSLFDETEDEALFTLAGYIFRIGQDDEELSYHPMRSDHRHRRRQVTGWNGAMPRARSIKTVDDLILLGFPDIHDRRWKLLCYFFEHPWFSRIWVIQEAALSEGVPCIVYHGHLRNFLPVLWAGTFISQNITLFRNMLRVGSTRNSSEVTEHARLLLQLSFAKSQWYMESLIWLTFRYGASDQRDKYYALISLDGEPSMATQPLVPDYGKPLGEVARDFTRYLIQASKSLLLLSLINSNDSELRRRFESRTPSWAYVPSNGLHNLRFGEQYVLSGWPYAIKRKAHAVVSNLGVKILPSEDPNLLVLGGIRKDELIDCPAREYGKPRLLDWCEKGYRRCNLMGTISIKNYLAQFFATVSAQHDFQDRDLRPSIDDLKSWLVHSQQMGLSIPEYLQPLLIELPEIDNYDIGNRHVIDRWIAMYETDGDFQYREFAVTKEGLLTVGPQAMQSGDLICLLHGGELPYVLRPAQEKYLFLGECYIHGLNLQHRIHSGKDLKSEWFCLA